MAFSTVNTKKKSSTASSTGDARTSETATSISGEDDEISGEDDEISGEDDESIISWDDISSMLGGTESSSETGLPSWGENYVQGVTYKYGSPALYGLDVSTQNLSNYPQYVEQSRKEQNQQYVRDLLEPTTEAVNSAFRTAAGGGIVNSSVLGDWMRDVAQSAVQSAESQQSESNIWAAEQNLEGLETVNKAYQDYASLLGEYLGLTRRSSSKSSGENSLLDYLSLYSYTT